MQEIGFALRVGKVEIAFLHADLIQNAVLRLFQTFFERFAALVLNKLIRVLIRSQIDDTRCKTNPFEHRNRTKRRFDACLIAVIDHKNLVGIPLHQPRLQRCERCSKRSYRVIESCLVHGNYVHIALADNQIFSP